MGIRVLSLLGAVTKFCVQCLWEHMFSFLLGICVGVELLDHSVTQCLTFWRCSQLALVVKNPPANAVDRRDTSSIPGSGKSPGGGLSSPLQYSCLGNPLDRGAWQATVHEVTKSQRQLRWPSTHSSMHWFFKACVRGCPWTPVHTPVEIERSLLWPCGPSPESFSHLTAGALGFIRVLSFQLIFEKSSL